MFSIVLSIVFVSAFTQILTEAWLNSGHWIAGTIARLTLEDEEMHEVVSFAEDLLEVYRSNWPGCKGIACSALWVRDFSSLSPLTMLREPVDGFIAFQNINFMRAPIKLGVEPEEGLIEGMMTEASKELPSTINVHTILDSATGALSQPAHYGSPLSTVLHFRLLLSLLVDAHEPCNIGSMLLADSDDRGCERILVGVSNSGHEALQGSKANVKNLRKVWETMGAYNLADWHEVNDEEMEAVARDVMAFYPKVTALQDGFDLDVLNNLRPLYQGTFNISTVGTPQDGKVIDSIPNWNDPDQMWTVYTGVELEDGVPKRLEITPEYRQFVENASKRQVAIAGYRLATLFTDIKNKMTEQLWSEIQAILTHEAIECPECAVCTERECAACTERDCAVCTEQDHEHQNCNDASTSGFGLSAAISMLAVFAAQ